MRFYAITFDKVVIRFYLMMAAVLVGMFSGYYAIAFLALPLFLSAILGVSFKSEPKEKQVTKVVRLPKQPARDLDRVA